MNRTLLVLGAVCLACGIASAQDRVALDKAQVELGRGSWNMALVPDMQDAGVMFGEVTKGAPFSAQRTEESVQTLGDGTHITNKSSVLYSRDSAGRVRREDDEWITIYDPVAGVSYRLNKKNHTGSKVELVYGLAAKIKLDEVDQTLARMLKEDAEKALNESKEQQGNAVTITSDGPNGRVYSLKRSGAEESLGSQVVNGVMADGKRFTSTIPAGDFGNDRPIQTVTESWYSPELHITILFKRSDPRDGDVVTQYTNIQRAEPNAGLFQLPAGYTLVKEKRRQEEMQ
jgi:hypothetical protein